MQLSAKELASFLGGTVEGDPKVTVSRPSKIEEGGEGTISFLGNLKYEEFAYSTTASILLVREDFTPREQISATLIRVKDVYAAIALLLDQFGKREAVAGTISDNAFIHESVEIGESVSIEAFTSINEGACIDTGTQLMSQVYIGKHAKIGKNVILYPGVKIMDGCEVGDNCIIHSNVVVGSDGFGFAPNKDGSYKKIAHVGNVVIEEDVEIGANTTIDRGTMGSTIIRQGVKLDNLVQVGHNVEIGAHTVIAAQAGIAGSTKIGKHCRIGGQVGFAGHISIADGTQIQAQSGIAGSIKEPNQALFGYPAIGYKDYIRSYAIFKQLPELDKRLHRLEKKLEDR
jgi:UDP-3-O-[3-hydroxymyristoyl] glucosamine N-acyltransferase